MKRSQTEHFQSLILAGGHLPSHNAFGTIKPAWYRMGDLSPGDRQYLERLSEFVNII